MDQAAYYPDDLGPDTVDQGEVERLRRDFDELAKDWAAQQAKLATLTTAARDLDEYIHSAGWVRLTRSDPRAVALRAALAK